MWISDCLFNYLENLFLSHTLVDMTATWKGKRVLVTGGTGFIGSVLVERLLQAGADVRVPIRSENYRALSRLREKIEWREGDLRDAEYCRQLLMGVDHVFHLASHRRNEDFHHEHCSDVLNGNVLMSVAMIQAIKDFPNTGVTFFSSANVPPSVDVIALAQREQLNGYILGKALCETLWLTAARQYGCPLLIVRAVGVYGERDTFSLKGNVIPSLMMKAESDSYLDVWGSGRQERVFIYVDDLVSAVLKLLEVGCAGIQYVMPPDVTTVKNLAETIRDVVKPGLEIRFDTSKPDGKRSVATLPLHPSLSTVSWTPLEDGIRKTFKGWKSKAKDTAAA